MVKSRRTEIYRPASWILTPSKFFRTNLKTPKYLIDGKQRVKGQCDFLRGKWCVGNLIFFLKHKAKFPLLRKHCIGWRPAVFSNPLIIWFRAVCLFSSTEYSVSWQSDAKGVNCSSSCFSCCWCTARIYGWGPWWLLIEEEGDQLSVRTHLWEQLKLKFKIGLTCQSFRHFHHNDFCLSEYRYRCTYIFILFFQ